MIRWEYGARRVLVVLPGFLALLATRAVAEATGPSAWSLCQASFTPRPTTPAGSRLVGPLRFVGHRAGATPTRL
jgi:hypothetical protein